jgi:hypothetical protein
LPWNQPASHGSDRFQLLSEVFRSIPCLTFVEANPFNLQEMAELIKYGSTLCLSNAIGLRERGLFVP